MESTIFNRLRYRVQPTLKDNKQALEPANETLTCRKNGHKSETVNTPTLNRTIKKANPKQKQTKETPSKPMNRKIGHLIPQPVPRPVPVSRKKSCNNSSPKKAFMQQKKRKIDMSSDSGDLSSAHSDSSSSESESSTSASTTSSSESSDPSGQSLTQKHNAHTTRVEMEASESISKLLLQNTSTPLPLVDKLQKWTAKDILRILDYMYQPSVCKLCDTQLNVVHRKLQYKGKLHRAKLLSLLKTNKLTHLSPAYFTWRRVKRRKKDSILPWEEVCFEAIATLVIDLFSAPAIHSPAVAEAVKGLRILQMLVKEGYLSSQSEFETELRSQLISVLEWEIPEHSPEFDAIRDLQEALRNLDSSTCSTD